MAIVEDKAVRHVNLSPENPQWPTQEERASQPACDLRPTTSYLHHHEESRRRFASGERQRRCPRCSRVYWPRWPRDAAKHGLVVDALAPAASSQSPCLSCPAEPA